MSEILQGDHEFYMEKDGEKAATIGFAPGEEGEADSSAIIITHTFVSEELRGGGVGVELVERVVQYARENHLKVVPMCSFASSVMERHTEMQDVLA
ncbi:N-acetyltransferase [Neobacillus mesonae]|nr:N-acetyltransferase [Neobacillus mesonae]